MIYLCYPISMVIYLLKMYGDLVGTTVLLHFFIRFRTLGPATFQGFLNRWLYESAHPATMGFACSGLAPCVGKDGTMTCKQGNCHPLQQDSAIR